MSEKKVITACRGKVLVTDLDSGEQKLKSGIIIQNDDGKVRGVHSRWCKVYSVGEDITDIKEGEWLLIDHGRWSRTIHVGGVDMNLIDYPKGVLAAAPERPEYIGMYQFKG